MCIIDEAAHVDRSLFTEVVFPILRVARTSMVCLSSPDGSDNHFSRWAQTKGDDGEPLMRVIHTVLICKRCMKLPQEDAIKCKHIKHTAHWISNRRSDKIKKLYANDPALAMQEFGGAIVSSHIRAFLQSEVEALFARPLVLDSATPHMIITTADNSGAGSSHLAVTSGYFQPNGVFVVSLCNFSDV